MSDAQTFPLKLGWGFIALPAVALVLFLAACSDDAQNAAGLSQGGIQRLNHAAGKVDGAVLMMAKELIASNVNPFLNKLPLSVDAKPEAEPPPPIEGQEQTVMPAADPFEGVTLVGISFQPKNAYALVSVGTGAPAQVVREGELLTTESGMQLKVGKIQQTQVDVRELGGGSGKSLVLPDIVGYTQTTSTPAGGSEEGGRGRGSSRGGKPMGSTKGMPPQTAAPEVVAPAEGKSPIIKLNE